jgi:hypothetical protein
MARLLFPWIEGYLLNVNFDPDRWVSFPLGAFTPRSMAEGVSLLESLSRFKQTPRFVFQE